MYERGRSCNERVRAVLVGDIMRGWHLLLKLAALGTRVDQGPYALPLLDRQAKF